eukprot:5469234-Pyramimonas_sp.AAC.1
MALPCGEQRGVVCLPPRFAATFRGRMGKFRFAPQALPGVWCSSVVCVSPSVRCHVAGRGDQYSFRSPGVATWRVD